MGELNRGGVTPGGEVVLYRSPDGAVRLDVRLERETVWLSLNQMAELFGRDKSMISRHLRSVFDFGELERGVTVAKVATIQREGKQGGHQFTDGNKRIGTLLFLECLRRNRLFWQADGTPRLADNATLALALLVAEIEPTQKDLMIRLILNLLEDEAA